MSKLFPIVLALLFFGCNNELKERRYSQYSKLETFKKNALIEYATCLGVNSKINLHANYSGSFKFVYHYEGGSDSFYILDSLVIPKGENIKLLMSADRNSFIHSLFIPDFDIREDISPNRFSSLCFEVNSLGTYDYYCDEICGVGKGHNGKVVVLPPEAEAFIDSNDNNIYDINEDFDDRNYNGKWDTGYDYWFMRKIAEHKAFNPLEGAALGEKKYSDLNCNTCHSNGVSQAYVGPSHVGLWDRKLKEYSSSQDPELEAENYIKESIRHPGRYIVPGYNDQMPRNYTKESGVSDKDIEYIIEYIKSLQLEIAK